MPYAFSDSWARCPWWFCQHELEGKEESKGRQQMTSDGIGKVPLHKLCYLLGLSNWTFKVVICWVPNNDHRFHMILKASYMYVRYWEYLNDLIDWHAGPKEPYSPRAMFKYTLEPEELDAMCMGQFTDRQLMNDPINGQNLYNCCIPNFFKLIQGHNLKISFVAMTVITGQDDGEYILRPIKVISASYVAARYAQLLIIILRILKK